MWDSPVFSSNISSIFKLNFFFIYYGERACQGIDVEVKEQFAEVSSSPSTLWVPEIELRPLSLASVPLTTELAHLPLNKRLKKDSDIHNL